MKYIKYIVLFIILITLSCSLKEPVENKKEEFKVGPGEKVLLKGRGPDELILYNECPNSVTFYINALGPVWDSDYDTVDTWKTDNIIVPAEHTTPGYGWDHDAVDPTDEPYFGYAIYEVGISGAEKTRISWIDDRYKGSGVYNNHDIYMKLTYNPRELKIMPEGGASFKPTFDSTFFFWKLLSHTGDLEPTVSLFNSYGLDEVTGVNISGPDSLASQQSGDFEAQQSPAANDRADIYMDYTWWLKVADGSFSEQTQWKNLRTVSYSNSESFRLKTKIWDIVHDVITDIDTHCVAVGPITASRLSAPDSLRPGYQGNFLAIITPSHRKLYNTDYDWAVWYIDDEEKKKEKKDFRAPPTGEWIDLNSNDGIPVLQFSSTIYDFKIRVIITDEAYGHSHTREGTVYLIRD